jgi:hypothetical protein
MWGVVAVSSYPVLAGVDTDLPFPVRALVVAGVIAFAVAVETLLAGLTVQVQETRIFMHLGKLPLVRRSVPFGEIESLDSVQYHPLRQFGGWGVRGWGAKKAWSARGDLAVALRLEGDRLLLIGSDHPRRLEERIRTAMGRR